MQNIRAVQYCTKGKIRCRCGGARVGERANGFLILYSIGRREV